MHYSQDTPQGIVAVWDPALVGLITGGVILIARMIVSGTIVLLIVR